MQNYKIIARSALSTLIEDTTSGYLYTVGTKNGALYVESDPEWCQADEQLLFQIHESAHRELQS